MSNNSYHIFPKVLSVGVFIVGLKFDNDRKRLSLKCVFNNTNSTNFVHKAINEIVFLKCICRSALFLCNYHR